MQSEQKHLLNIALFFALLHAMRCYFTVNFAALLSGESKDQSCERATAAARDLTQADGVALLSPHEFSKGRKLLFTFYFVTTRMPCGFCTVQRLRDLQDAFNEGEWLRGIIYFSSRVGCQGRLLLGALHF